MSIAASRNLSFQFLNIRQLNFLSIKSRYRNFMLVEVLRIIPTFTSVLIDTESKRPFPVNEIINRSPLQQEDE